VDRTLRALADPTRREIVRLLRQGDLTAGEIAEKFPMTAATVSHHLSTLKEAGLVSAERQGRTIVYSLNATVVQELVGDLLRNLGVGKPS
jgi:DNA-binding transcriptional ArsR family regulator